MTLRLVSLISLLLLVSVAAVGLLMGQYQAQVRREVEQTASAVGRATLMTFDHLGSLPVPAQTGDEARRLVYRKHSSGARVDEAVRLEHLEDGEWVVDEESSTGDVEKRFIRLKGELAGCPAEDDCAPGMVSLEWIAERVAEREKQGYPTHTHADTVIHTANHFVVDLAEVRAESDPANGLVMRFPHWIEHAGQAGDGGPTGHSAETQVDVIVAGSPIVATPATQELRVPIPAGDTEALFARWRWKALLTVLGVFAVGSLLATGLATRFTRPIRKLDAALRRISSGDLDVEVDVHGKDEIGRLALAFNEMTGKLRANRERSRELVRREKLSALGRLAAGVAHDVRNPLHAIGLTLDDLDETARPEGAESAEAFDRSLGVIREEIRRLDRLVGNFLRFARSERAERGSVDLALLLGETARLVEKEAERRGISVILELDRDVPPVIGDAEALRSSVLNLVVNSFDAMPDGGKLELCLARRDGVVELEVKDDGDGIPESERERVFEFSYTTRASGSGMGLAMVHHCVVEEHGGRVTLDSAPGEGTRVRISLPVAEDEASPEMARLPQAVDGAPA